MAITKLVIDRSKWLCGTTIPQLGSKSKLRNERGAMCCMGFLARACHIPAQELDDRSTLAELPIQHERRLPLPLQIHGESAKDKDIDKFDESIDKFYTANDDTRAGAKRREERLKNKFKKELGIKLSFVGKYPPKEK